MKTLKVKFTALSLLAIMTVSVFMTSCEQQIVEAPINEVDRVQQLESDPNYITLNSLNDQLLNEIRNVMTIKGLIGEDLKNMYINGETDLLAAVFEGTQAEAIMDEIEPIADQLSNEYSDLILTGEGFDEESILMGFDKLESISIESRCNTMFVLCAGIAFGTFVTCVGGDVENIPRVAACGALYAAMLVYCDKVHCPPKE